MPHRLMLTGVELRQQPQPGSRSFNYLLKYFAKWKF